MIDAEKAMEVGTREMLRFHEVKILLDIGLPDACVLVSQLQLALRHPENPSAPTTRQHCDAIIGQVERVSPDLASVLRLGFNKQYDSVP